MDKWDIYCHSKPEDFLCKHCQFPRHTQVTRRTKCKPLLLKAVKTSKSTLLRPLKIFLALRELLLQPTILNLRNNWCSRKSSDASVVEHVCDWQMWETIQVTEGRSFLSKPNNIGLSLNVDWFRPFKHSL